MVKVCHMTSVHTRYDIRIFQKECTSLSKAGFEVYLIVNDPYEDEEKDGVHILSASYKPENRMDRMLNAARKVYEKAVQIKADIYHFHDPELLFYGYWLKKKGNRVIFDSHEFTWKQIECREYIPKMIRKVVGFLYRKCEEMIVGKVDAVIVPCTYDGRSYFGKKCRREILINNFPSLGESDMADVHFSDRKQQACYIGRLTKERGVREMAKACTRAGIPLILAGVFSTGQLKEEVSGMSSYTKYLGKLHRPEVKKLLNESYMGISILQDEGQYRHLDNLPTKVYEYMEAGIPVIVSDFPYYKKIIEKYGCGKCVNPENIEEIAQTMKWMLDHPQEAGEMGRNGKKLVTRKFNWMTEEKKLLKLYDEILKE